MRITNTARRLGLAIALGGGLAFAPLGASAKGGWKAEGTHTLPDVSLASFLQANVPGLGLVDGHGIDLGGIGSDLWRGPGDGPGVYWMITDRGPNGEGPRTFPVPEFTPFILQVRATGGVIEVLQALPITGPGITATGVTGIANLVNVTEPPALSEPIFECDGTTSLAANVNGLDTEGLVRTHDGTFWVVEEYGPSILKIDAQGQVLKRCFPEGLLASYPNPTAYPSADTGTGIPELFGLKRKLNRGFEGLAISPDEKTLYIALQSPLVNPTTAVGNAARNTRFLAFDIASEQVVAEYVYRFDFTGPLNGDDGFDVPSLGATGLARPRDMKVSGLAMLDQHRMLVLERTDFKAKIYRIDLREATNILGTSWDLVTTAPSLETLNADGTLEANGIAPFPKTHIVTLDSTQGFPTKIEGIATVDGKTLVIANDNDFGVGSFSGGGCTLVDTNNESQIMVLRLDKPLK